MKNRRPERKGESPRELPKVYVYQDGCGRVTLTPVSTSGVATSTVTASATVGAMVCEKRASSPVAAAAAASPTPAAPDAVTSKPEARTATAEELKDEATLSTTVALQSESARGIGTSAAAPVVSPPPPPPPAVKPVAVNPAGKNFEPPPSVHVGVAVRPASRSTNTSTGTCETGTPGGTAPPALDAVTVTIADPSDDELGVFPSCLSPDEQTSLRLAFGSSLTPDTWLFGTSTSWDIDTCFGDDLPDTAL